MDQILTAAAAAQHLGCSITTIEERARAGDLPGLLWGDGGWVFPAAAFYARINELAIEQAAVRRKGRQPTPVATATPTAPGKPAKAPPALPRLQQV